MRIMASEMKAAAADYNLTGDEMDFLGKKSRLLNSQISKQEEIIRELEAAIARTVGTTKEHSATTDGWRIKLNNARASLSNLKKELENTDQGMSEVGRDAGRVGRQLEQGLGESADDVSRKMDALVNTLNSDVSDLKKMVTFSTFADIGGGLLDGAKNLYDGAKQLTDGTREYRRQMSFLESNAINAGLDPDVIKEKAFEVASITGNLDGAVEGMNSLISAGLDMDEITLAAERLIGAVLKFPGVLSFEGLAEGLQESVVSGTPTGPYLELLERTAQEYGDVEKYVELINKSFKNAPHLEARQSVGLSWLSGRGFEEAKKLWEDQNKPIQDATDAQNDWNQAISETGAILEPVMTKITRLGTAVVNEANDILSGEETIDEKAVKVAKMAGRWVDEMLHSEDAAELEKNSHLYWQQQKDIVVGQMKEVFGQEEDEDFGAWMNFQKLLMQDEDTGVLGKAASEEFLKGMHDYLLENTPALEKEAKDSGKGIGSGLGDGVLEQTPYAVSQVRNMMALMQAELNKGVVMPTIRTINASAGAGSGSGAENGKDLNVNVSMSMDGKVLTRSQSSYISDDMGARVDRIEKYG